MTSIFRGNAQGAVAPRDTLVPISIRIQPGKEQRCWLPSQRLLVKQAFRRSLNACLTNSRRLTSEAKTTPRMGGAGEEGEVIKT